MAKPNITEVGRVTVPAADQDRSLAFYTETLGFETRVDETFADGQMRWIEGAPARATALFAQRRLRWTEAPPPGATTSIALTPPMGDFQPGRQTGIIVSTDDIEASHAALKDAGGDIDPDINSMGAPVPPMFAIRDPEGNELTIVEPIED